MLCPDACRERRRRFWESLGDAAGDHVRLADPLHLIYLANFHVDPVSLNAGSGATLVLRRDGHARLLHDDRLGAEAAAAHVDDRTVAPWYDGRSPGRGPRQLALVGDVNPAHAGLGVHDRPGHPDASAVVNALARLRRQKNADELAVLARCMRATEAGHAWARAAVRPGMTELDVYAGVVAACCAAVGRPVVVYGDFAVSPGPARRGGPPTGRALEPGDTFILDFSVVLHGYRSDFTNTLVVGAEPTADQRRLHGLCLRAMAAGEGRLRAGAACKEVRDAVNDVFDREGLASAFGHHAGHGLGLSHPEAPFFVADADEVLLRDDVVTLEPGLYVEGVGGFRIEHDYRVTADGYERLSRHEIVMR